MHIRYSGWASRKVLEAALVLSAEDRIKPMSVSHESIAKTPRRCPRPAGL